VSEKYRKKIELMVRKPDRGEEPQERLAACPFCQLPGPEGELQCISCQNTIPFDIATGTHRKPCIGTQSYCLELWAYTDISADSNLGTQPAASFVAAVLYTLNVLQLT
jgi:hypothetical protein